MSSSSSNSRIKKDTQKFKTLTEKGVKAFGEGKHRESADFYLEAVLAAPDKWMDMGSMAPSTRYHTFHGYTSILREKYFVPSDQDFTNLSNKFLYNEKEPIIFRVEAGFTLGLISWDKGDREEAGDYYRDVISLGNQVTRQENERRYVGAAEDVFPVRSVIKKVEDGIKEIVKLARENLDKLQSRNKVSIEDLLAPKTFPRSDGTTYPKEMRTTGAFSVPAVLKYTNQNPQDLKKRQTVGGSACDCCHKTLEELGMDKLSRCVRCGRSYYCSRECQKHQWKHVGHKACCRAPGQIETNDIMRLQNLTGARSKVLNGMLAVVIEKDTTTTTTKNASMEQDANRWKVRVMNDAAEIVSVAEKNIEHIRPEK